MIVSANRMADLTSLDYYFERLRRRLDGLTDDEYLWEPVSPCISIEPGARGQAARVAPNGIGEFTTIAWRLCHIGDLLREERNWRWLGRTPALLDAEMWQAPTASDAVGYVEEAFAAWSALVASVADRRLVVADGARRRPLCNIGSCRLRHPHHGRTDPPRCRSRVVARPLSRARRPHTLSASQRYVTAMPCKGISDRGMAVSAQGPRALDREHLPSGHRDEEPLGIGAPRPRTGRVGTGRALPHGHPGADRNDLGVPTGLRRLGRDCEVRAIGRERRVVRVVNGHVTQQHSFATGLDVDDGEGTELSRAASTDEVGAARGDYTRRREHLLLAG